MKNKMNLNALRGQLNDGLRQVQRFGFVLFGVLVIAIYGFVLWRINSLSQAEPSTAAVSNQVQAARVPHIDESVVKQLQSLQDNSVSVQSLFDEARNNPFQ